MLKIVLIALICGLVITALKNINNELSIIASICAGILVVVFSLDYIAVAIDFFNKLIEFSGVDKNIYKIIFKLISIAYLVEFSEDTLIDFGLKSLSNKVVFVGKIIIFITSLPIIYAVYNLILGMLE